MKKIIYISIIFLLVIAGCKKVEKVDTYLVSLGEVVITSGADNVSVSATYTYEYTLKSVKFMCSDNESLDNAMVGDAHFANGTVTATADGLRPNTTYFFKFEFYNGISRMWSEVRNFRTLEEPVVTELAVTTAEVTNVLETSAVCGGEVVSEGSSPVIARGVCYGLSENPTLENCIDTTLNGAGTGVFVSNIINLERETKYYVRAYATDSDTTCYGEQRSFETPMEIVYSLPTVITNNVDGQGVGQYNALLSGNVTDDGNMPITGCGFWYGTGHDTLGGFTKPTTYNTGGFSLNVTDGIEPGTTYFARAYADNEIGRRFGNEVSFTTLSLPPTPDPQVFTLPSSDVTSNSAKIKGRIYYDGTDNPIKKGFVYGLDVNDMNNDIDCTSQSDPFEAVLSGLTPNTTYYYKAYAQYAGYAQTFYGGVESFTTQIEITEPTIHTVNPSNITTTSANSGGYGITDGNSPIINKGVCWATFDNPTLESCNGHTEDGSGTDDFTSVAAGLAPGTTYYVRAYAKNQAGKVGYGEPLGFVTMIMHQAPDVVTNTASGISGSGATLGGSVTNNYNSNITECWIMWGDGDDAMTNRLDCNAGMTFSGTVTGLQNNHMYSFKAFAKNEYDETGSGDIQHFTTNNEIPDVETLDATAITANSATMNGRVNDDHGINITECWIMWGRSASSMNNRLSCTAGADFSATVDTLQPNTTYYFTAYAKNANGQEGNGAVKQLHTSPTIPTVITSDITNIAQTTATGGGNVTSDGGATVTARGICWSTLPNPTISDSHTTDGSGTGIFTSSMTGLTPNTTYYVKAYATNSAGTAYGEPLGFVTMIMHQAPDVVTNTASGISGSGATLGGSVTNNYNSNITECWIMWGDGDDAMTNRLDCNAGMTFSGTVTGLQNNYTYSFQAFAKNEFNETGSGDIQHFTTNNEIPDVETLDATAITANSATMNGRVNDDHGINITECWIMWGRNASSMSNRLSCTAGADFSATVDTLQPNTTYYFTAYAKNANGQEGNGTVKQLLTSPTTPTVITSDITDIAQTTATGGGNVTNDGGATVTARGICWSTSQNPTIANSHTTDGTGTGQFVSYITNLQQNTTYYVRAYATNGVGTAYGEQKVLTTDMPEVPEGALNGLFSVSPDKQVFFSQGCLKYQASTRIWRLADNQYDYVGDDNHNISPTYTGWIDTYCWGTSGWNSGANQSQPWAVSQNDNDYLPGGSTTSDLTGDYINADWCFYNAIENAGNQSGLWRTLTKDEWTYLIETRNNNPLYGNGQTTNNYLSFKCKLTIAGTQYIGIMVLADNDSGNVQSSNYAATSWNSVPQLTDIPEGAAFLVGSPNRQGTIIIDIHSYGSYCSTTHESASNAYHLNFNQSGMLIQADGRHFGFNVRPVAEIDNPYPKITTNNVSNITGNSAVCGGSVISEGYSGVIARGVCWSNDHTPSISDPHTTDGSGTGSFTSNITGLSPATTYYVRAYATNSYGTVYGEQKIFTTSQQIFLPTVMTSDITNIAQTTATGGGNVTSDGGATVTARGICWSTSQNPTIANSHTTDGTGTGTFTSSMTGLTPNTMYYVKAYATNSAGTAYGEQKIFTTSQQIFLPTVITSDITNIAQTTATGGGNVTNDGGATVTARGICWSTLPNPTTANSHTTNGTGTGTFTSSMTGLTPNTTYYVKAYATNSAGTVYGEQKSFTTSQQIFLPTVITSDITNIAQTTATGSGNVTSDGGATVTARGICWSTLPNPTTANSHTTDGTGTGTFTSSMTELTPNTTYYVKAYATNSAGTAYGEQKTFTTTQEETGNYFCITALDAGTTRVYMRKEGNAPTVYLEYKVNNGPWNTFTVGSTYISLSQNDKVYFKAPNGQPNDKFAIGSDNNIKYNRFQMSGNVDLSGNIMYLLDPTGEMTSLQISNKQAFAYLFGGENIINANQLTLPATSLSEQCYRYMFDGCSSLTSTPNLPATTLAESCYEHMFIGCSSLTSTPDLPATTLATRCYTGMFENCSSLSSVSQLPATTLAELCYWRMFKSCTSLVIAPELPATTLATRCYDSMFSSCTSLVIAPELPATIMTTYCYCSMFYGCSSLTSTPNLPATTLASGCYYCMFGKCTSIITAQEILPATTLASGCYVGMFQYCSSLTTAPILPAAVLAESCYRDMFANCSQLNYIKMLGEDFSNVVNSWYDPLYNWVGSFYSDGGENLNVFGVSPTGTFIKKAGVTIPSPHVTSGIPSGWTVHNE